MIHHFKNIPKHKENTVVFGRCNHMMVGEELGFPTPFSLPLFNVLMSYSICWLTLNPSSMTECKTTQEICSPQEQNRSIPVGWEAITFTTHTRPQSSLMHAWGMRMDLSGIEAIQSDQRVVVPWEQTQKYTGDLAIGMHGELELFVHPTSFLGNSEGTNAFKNPFSVDLLPLTQHLLPKHC